MKLTHSLLNRLVEDVLKEESKIKLTKQIIKRIAIQEMMKLNEGPKPIHHSQAKSIQVWKNHIPKAHKLLKKLVSKGQVEIDTKSNRIPGHIRVTTTKKLYNKILELLMKNNIKVRG